MVPHVRPSLRAVRRPPFSLRRLTLCFALMALVVIGIGLLLKTVVTGAVDHRMAAGAVVAVTIVVASCYGARGRERAARLIADSTSLGGADSLAEHTAPDAIKVIDDYTCMAADEFEYAVARLCERDGCRDVRVVGGANDLGADVVATAPDGRVVIIQCKRYRETNKVGSQDLQRFGGTCFAVHGADIAACVTTSTFTEPAADYARQCEIQCFDQDALEAWAAEFGPTPWQ